MLSVYHWSNNNDAVGINTASSTDITFPNFGSTFITVCGENVSGDGAPSTYTVTVYALQQIGVIYRINNNFGI